MDLFFFLLAGSYQLASAAPVNMQLNTSAAHVLLQKGACHYLWPLMSAVKALRICDRRGWEPSVKAMLPDVFCHLFRLPEQAFALLHLLRGSGVSDCICHGCSPPASSSSWHLKLARLALVYTWNAQATQPCESQLSVSQHETLKRWPACWTEPQCKPLLHWERVEEYTALLVPGINGVLGDPITSGNIWVHQFTSGISMCI